MKTIIKLSAALFIVACFSACTTEVYETETVVLPYPSKPKPKPKPKPEPSFVDPAKLEAVGPSDR